MEVTVPRGCLGLQNDKLNDVNLFRDTSPRAYGAVACLRTQDEETTVLLISSKTRVAPIKKLSLPRLELMGMVIGARLKDDLTGSLNLEVTNRYLWTNSEMALHWVRASAQ